MSAGTEVDSGTLRRVRERGRVRRVHDVSFGMDRQFCINGGQSFCVDGKSLLHGGVNRNDGYLGSMTVRKWSIYC